jgi:hypothetical protein
MTRGQSVERRPHWRKNRQPTLGEIGLRRQDELHFPYLLRRNYRLTML